MIPGDRADELGLTEEDGPGGFYVYNPETTTEQYTIADDCAITMIGGINSNESVEVPSKEEFIAVLQERGEENEKVPYSFVIEYGEITEISQQYVP